MHIKLQFNFALTGQSCIGTIKVLFWYFGLRCDICLCFTWIFFMFLVLIWLPYISLACLLHLLTGLIVYLSLNIYLGLKIIYIFGFFILHRGYFYWIVLQAACIKSCIDLTVMLLFIWCESWFPPRKILLACVSDHEIDWYQ